MVQASTPLRLALRCLQAIDCARGRTRTRREMAEYTGAPDQRVNRAVAGLVAGGCLVDTGKQRAGQTVYELGSKSFGRYVAQLSSRSVRTSSGLDPVERAALAAAMKFVRAWPRAVEPGSKQMVTARLVQLLVRLSSPR
jgi:hypothetical protein